MAEITIKMTEESAKNLLAKADSIKYLLELSIDTPEGQVFEDICNQIRKQTKETSTVASTGMSKQEIKRVIFNYLCDYAEDDPVAARGISIGNYPNWYKFGSYQNQYPQLMNALMEGGDEEFENIVDSVIETWSK